MRTIRRNGATALTAAIALTLAAVPAVLVAGGATTPPDGPTTVTPASDAAPNTLVLSTTPESGVVSFAGQTQQFSGGQFCDLTALDGEQADLLEITGIVGPEIDSSDLAGFRGGQIGVFEQSNASQCFRVDAGSFTDVETLGLGLGGDIEDTFGPMLAEAASFDLEMRTKDVSITATTYLDDQKTGEFPFTTPRNNKIGTHRTFEIADEGLLFDRVELKAVAGSFSLEGGLHSGSPTTFDLVSQADAYFCNGDGVNTLEKDNVLLTYLENADGTPCTAFGVRLEGTDDLVTFRKPLDVDPNAQFIFDIVWTVEGSGTPAVELPTAQIDFESGAELFQDMPYCEDYLYTDGELTGITDPADLTDLALLDFREDIDGTQYACVAEPRSADLSAAEVTVTDRIFLIGDARMRL